VVAVLMREKVRATARKDLEICEQSAVPVRAREGGRGGQ
jgi:hypothetical protein